MTVTAANFGAFSSEKWKLFTRLRDWLMGHTGEASGPDLLCHSSDAKWSVAWRGHLRQAHLDNELRSNPKLRWTHYLSPTLSFSCSFLSVYTLVSHSTTLAGPQAYFLPRTWSIPPSHSPNPPSPNSISFFPHIFLEGITLQTSPSTGVSHKIIMISTLCFLLQFQGEWRAPWDISAFLQFHTMRNIWGLTFCAATDIS